MIIKCVCNCLEANTQCVFYIFLKYFGNIQTTNTHIPIWAVLLFVLPI